MTGISGCLSNRDAIRLFLISFTALFLEMAAIRWLNSTTPVLSYFNNLILISCFFGLGLGCLLARRKVDLIHWFALVFIVFVAGVIVSKRLSIPLSYMGDYIFAPHPEADPNVITVPMSALAGFFANMLFFVVLGQELGRRLESMGNPLKAYSVDIAGSLSGTLAAMALSWAGTAPHVWFAAGCLFLCLLLPKKPLVIAVSVALSIFGCFLIRSTYSNQDRWSPYYKVTAEGLRDAANRGYGYIIGVDGLRIQDALDFSGGLEKTELHAWIPYYNLPYSLIRPQKALYLGAGSGNEAAVALINGVPDIHAVEIDPVIAGFGRSLHPNRPYLDKRVRLSVNDARAFLSSCKAGSYDLVVMSALDSHKQVSGLSSLRLESYIYTVEAFQQVRRIMKPDGMFILNLSTGRPWMALRTHFGIEKAFGRTPLILHSNAGPMVSVAYVAGGGAGKLDPEKLAKDGITVLPGYERPADLLLCTDNWPFMYLEKNRIPPFNLAVLVLVLILTFTVVMAVESSARRPNLHYFFLGAGFMLLETRSITQMALLFGLTWHVTALVVAAVLLAIFLVNQLVLKGRGISSRAAYPLLFATLALGYFFPFGRLLALGIYARLAVSALVVGLPIVWAAFIFSNSFKAETRVNAVFGANLLGVVLGGAMEYVGNISGLNFLYILALVLYAASLAAGWKKVTSP